MNTDAYLLEPKVQSWIASLTQNRCTVNGITPLHLLSKANGELLFALLKADAVTPDGQRLLPYIFIRGHACIIVPLLKNIDTGEERFLMIEQWRTGNGALCLEFPAGMLDRDVHDPAGVALRELMEETGLVIGSPDIFPLCDHPLYSSPGASDEAIYYYGCVVELHSESFTAFEGRCTGATHENERIRVTLKTRVDAECQMTSLQARLGFCLFERAAWQLRGANH